MDQWFELLSGSFLCFVISQTSGWKWGVFNAMCIPLSPHNWELFFSRVPHLLAWVLCAHVQLNVHELKGHKVGAMNTLPQMLTCLRRAGIWSWHKYIFDSAEVKVGILPVYHFSLLYASHLLFRVFSLSFNLHNHILLFGGCHLVNDINCSGGGGENEIHYSWKRYIRIFACQFLNCNHMRRKRKTGKPALQNAAL